MLEHVLEDLFRDADMILHAGDIVSRRVLERLDERDVIAVCGNMDDYEVAGLIPQVRVVEAAGIRIGLIHGWGSSEGLAHRVASRFSENSPDIVVYGHSHIPFWGTVRGQRLFNPGSASMNRHGSPGTVGWLLIDEEEVIGQIVRLKG